MWSGAKRSSWTTTERSYSKVETKRLNEAVKRNADRFPSAFMFQLTSAEAELLRSQIATSKTERRGGRRYLPNVFTEHVVVMLSSVLNSPRAIQMSLLVVSAFVRMRELIHAHHDLAERIGKLELTQEQTTSVVDVLVEDLDRLALEIRQMKTRPEPAKRRIGFTAGGD